MEDVAIAWAAGLFEGEGSIFLANQASKTKSKTVVYTYARMNLKMTDRDVVERFQGIVGCGAIYFKPKAQATWKDAWNWQLNDRAACARVVEMFWPYLGERRKLKAAECGLAPVSQ